MCFFAILSSTKHHNIFCVCVCVFFFFIWMVYSNKSEKRIDHHKTKRETIQNILLLIFWWNDYTVDLFSFVSSYLIRIKIAYFVFFCERYSIPNSDVIFFQCWSWNSFIIIIKVVRFYWHEYKYIWYVYVEIQKIKSKKCYVIACVWFKWNCAILINYKVFFQSIH